LAHRRSLLRGVNTTEANGLTCGLAGLEAARNEASLQLAIVTAAARTGDPVATVFEQALGERRPTGHGARELPHGAGRRAAGALRRPDRRSGQHRPSRVRAGLLARNGSQPLPTTTASTAAPLYGTLV